MLVGLAALALTLAAVAGLALFAGHLRGAPPPLAAGLGHGGLAVAGVAVLVVAVMDGGLPLPVNAALVMFVLAVIGGAFVLLFRLEGERPPGFMVVLHALAAAAGLGMLGWTLLP